jgi:hypothetical protein
MTSSIQLVRASTHADKSWRPLKGYEFARSSLVAAIAAEEVVLATRHFPLAFLAGETTSLVAVLGLRTGENLFVAPSGRWAGQYVPAVLRSHPFRLLKGDDGNFHLGYDEASGMLGRAGEGEAFFDEAGKATERIQELLKFLMHLNTGLNRTTDAGTRLAALGVLEPWPLKVRAEEGEIAVNGLLRVNEASLAELSEQDFLSLRKGGALAMAYAQLFSMPNVAVLAQLLRSHQQHAAAMQKQHAEITSMFSGDADEDEIDWDTMLRE